MPFQKMGTIFFALTPLIMISACGILTETFDSMRNPREAEVGGSESTTVEILFESDAPTLNDLTIEIGSKNNPISVNEQDISLPYKRTFHIPGDTFIPLNFTRASASKPKEGNFIKCIIKYNNQEVASHYSEGPGATASCEKKLQFGPQ
jgi:hypothetical protein